ncbi:gluconolactonase [Xaviernesmea oryzae]|uniref:Gluconolactonase n=1 Tax=Xaviernesmea oryzae TaxID=464029 RepID=A0A1Q9AY40_9HYPH|nr:SMP-30/gluconolactonase/LRE family protein [Xaviernesmea oryzae]OLP60372.1 gluconolactonase [Xaviernesmea oryzae]SEK21072.1 gluconolactonase [Xaviernesmea oryzae]
MTETPLYTQHDSRFAALIQHHAAPDLLYEGCRWAEGPVWFADQNVLLWSDIPNARMLRFAPEADGLGTVSVFRAASNYSNGHTRDRQGRLVSCEHGTRRVTRTEIDGTITVLADRYDGKALNSPNDVVVSSDGAVWFTDPTYGIASDYEGYRSEVEQAKNRLYRIDPASGAVEAMAEDFEQPNGLAFSPDEGRLYVVDSGAPRHIRVFDVQGGRRLSGGDVFFALDAEHGPDGLRLDTQGNVWAAAGKGVQVFSPEGTSLGRIAFPQRVSNLTFGGPKRNRLFVTATRSLHALYVSANGAQWP